LRSNDRKTVLRVDGDPKPVHGGQTPVSKVIRKGPDIGQTPIPKVPKVPPGKKPT
jgi:hypothetical protein